MIFAFQHGRSGDIFVQKAPAVTIETLAKALLELYKADNPIKVIGTRHGEKLYETLVNREEMAKAEDLGEYYRIPADTEQIAQTDDYTSHNTYRMNVEETIKLLLKLESIREDVEKL